MSYLVLLETSGNQSFLFATNRLKENVGASEMIWSAGTRWVLKAVKGLGGPDLWDDDLEKLRGNIERGGSKEGIEVILATSGKALLIVQSSKSATAIVDAVTRRALKEAPGLDVSGAVVAYNGEQDPIHDKVKEVHERFNVLRGRRAGPMLRHLQLPMLDLCASSGRPAAAMADGKGGFEPLSVTSLQKRGAARAWSRRLRSILRRYKADEVVDLWFPDNLDRMESQFDEMDWVAVVHADGNGMGQTFLSFDEHCGSQGDPSSNRLYIDKLRTFSLALDRASEGAFVAACATLPKRETGVSGRRREVSPIVPLLLGGDDLTVMVEGRYALAFTQEFLRSFEAGTAASGVLSEIAKKSIGAAGFGAAAGVAIVKPHFPFHSTYDLAESLLGSAKQVKKHLGPQGSALDFHILFDASYTGLDTIRKRLQTGEATHLTAGPYVVSDTLGNMTWATNHGLEGLCSRVKAVNERDPETGRRKLPNSQLHALRESLFRGASAADDHFNALTGRYGDQGLSKFSENDKAPYTLFRKRAAGGRETRFLEALATADFWKDARDIGESEGV